jgi:probable HAF family extracellular repeat protein
MDRNTLRPLCLLGLCIAGACLAGPTYTVTDLGDLGGSGAAALGINDLGHVVGATGTDQGIVVGFFWNGDYMSYLEPLPGGDYARAVSVNNSDQVVGTSTDSQGRERAVIWEQNDQGIWLVADLGTLPGGQTANANRINDSGQVVGRAGSSFGPYHAFLYEDGQMTDLGKLNYPDNIGYSEALGLNDAGHASGYAYAPLWGPDHAFYYDGAKETDITPPGQFTFARGYAINNKDVIGGTTILPGGQSTGFEAALWTQAGGWNEIGIVPGLAESEGYDLNEKSEVVGRSFDLAIPDFRGFVYTGGEVLDLNAVSVGSPAKIVEAWAINESGQIAAVAVQGDHSFALLISPGTGCYPDFTGDGTLDLFDFLAFVNTFNAGGDKADCDGQGGLDLFDFLCYTNSVNAGC